MARTFRFPKPIHLSTALGAAAVLFTAAACSAGAGAEIATAAEHAGYAANAATIEDVHMHLHHAINCLVGAKGEGFDPRALDPCAQRGNGAIPDSKNMKTKKSLESALKLADKGLASGNLSMAQEDAHLVNGMLKKTEPTAK